jgi:cytochrome c556
MTMTARYLQGAAAGLLAMLVSAGALAADSVSAEKAVDYRASYMTVLKWNSGPMGQMLKGKAAFDDEAFLRHARDLATAARLDLLGAFPEGSITEDSDAREEIWFDWEDFEQKFADFRTAAAGLGEAADAGDVEATKAAFGELGKTCKACHKAYKE